MGEQEFTVTSWVAKPISTFRTLLFRWYIPGIYLGVLYYIGICLVVSTMSAHQLRHKIENIDINGRSVTVARVKEFNEELADNSLVEIAKDNLDSFGYELQDARESLNNLLEESDELRAALREDTRKLDDINKKIISLDALGEKDSFKRTKLSLEQRASQTIIEVKQDKFSFISYKVDTAFDETKQLFCALKKAEIKLISASSREKYRINKLLNDYGYSVNPIELDSITIPAEQEVGKFLEEKVATRTTTEDRSTDTSATDCTNLTSPLAPPPNIALINDRILEVQGDLKFWSNHTELEATIQADVVTGTKLFWDWITTMVKVWRWGDFTELPAEMLTLLVVAIMGALGATISLTREYMGDEVKQGVSDYLFKPVLGTVTAFAVFILAKAGFLIISDTGATGDGATLSPFFISFIGLMSGLLAEDALNTILHIGRTWFKESSHNKERWGVGLKNHVKDTDKLALIKYTKVSAETLEQWLDETKTIPTKAQRTIASYLRIEQRKLFTDLAPNEMIDTLPD